MPDKELISKIYKELIQCNSKIKSDFKMGRGTEETFFQRRHANSQKVHEKVLSITNHQKLQIKNHYEISHYTF